MKITKIKLQITNNIQIHKFQKLKNPKNYLNLPSIAEKIFFNSTDSLKSNFPSLVLNISFDSINNRIQ